MKGRLFFLIMLMVLVFTLTSEGRLRFTVIYEVKEGDTLMGIANRFNVSLADLLKVNNLHENSIIRIEDDLIIPYSQEEEIPVFYSNLLEPLPYDKIYNLGEINYAVRIREAPVLVDIPLDKTILYRVQPGDNLYSLARYFNTTIKEIRALNNLEGSMIHIGQQLLLPTLHLTPRQSFGRTVAQSELELLARTISGEARGEPLLGQVAVGAVIINRVLSPAFPNTLQEVIYQPRQFSCVCDGQINRPPTASSYIAARRALEGEDPTMGALYFYNPRTAVNVAFFERVNKIMEIGNHVFAR